MFPSSIVQHINLIGAIPGGPGDGAHPTGIEVNVLLRLCLKATLSHRVYVSFCD